jgi:hypothetical protein
MQKASRAGGLFAFQICFTAGAGSQPKGSMEIPYNWSKSGMKKEIPA